MINNIRKVINCKLFIFIFNIIEFIIILCFFPIVLIYFVILFKIPMYNENSIFILPSEYTNNTEIQYKNMEIIIITIGSLINVIDIIFYCFLLIYFLIINIKYYYEFNIKNNFFIFFNMIGLYIRQTWSLNLGAILHKLIWNMYVSSYFTFCLGKIVIYLFFIPVIIIFYICIFNFYIFKCIFRKKLFCLRNREYRR